MPNITVLNGGFTEKESKSELKKEKEKEKEEEKENKAQWWMDILTNKMNIILVVIILALLYMLFKKFNQNE